MSAFDPNILLQPVSAERISGEDLSYDVEYASLLRDAAGTPEQQIGDSRIEASDPDWRSVRARALDLFARSHDLELACLLTVSGLELDGLPGLALGLRLIAGMLEDRWETFYPQLDPDDGFDPLVRMNLLANLAAPPGAEGDTIRLVDRLRRLPLAESRRLGRFGLRHIDLAEGAEAPLPDETVPTADIIAAAFRDTEPELLDARRAAAGEAQEALARIVAAANARGGVSAVNLSRLTETLGRIVQRLSGPAQDAQPAPSDGGSADEPAPGTALAVASSNGGPGVVAIRSQEDVLRAIDLICDYYARHERSSPVPIFLARARRLVGRPFEEIINDMVPDAMDHVRLLGGIPEPQE